MKLVLLAATAALLNAQAPIAAKPDSVPKITDVKPAERMFTPEESLKLENAMLRILLAQKKFDIDGFNKEIAPYQQTEKEIVTAACKSVGVPEDKVQTECGTAGFAPDGGMLTGPDGKPIPRKVWKVQAAPAK